MFRELEEEESLFRVRLVLNWISSLRIIILGGVCIGVSLGALFRAGSWVLLVCECMLLIVVVVIILSGVFWL